MSTRRSAAAAAAAVLAGALVLAGCSDGGSEAEPTVATQDAPGATTDGPTEPEATDSPSPDTEDSPTDSAVGELVEGFPTDVVPVPPGAQVSVSTVAEADGRRQVSLAGQTDLSAEEVVAFYRDALVAQEFTETQSTLPEGVAGSTFSRSDGSEILTLTVVTAGGAQQFTIGGFIAGG